MPYFYSKTKASEFIIDETLLRVGTEIIWLWVDIESETKNMLAISLSKEGNMSLLESIFFSKLWINMTNREASSDGGN